MTHPSFDGDEQTFAPEVINDDEQLLDTDVDFDAPDADGDDETETLPAETTTDGDKPAKAPKVPARPPVPEGYVSPVAFAKLLTEHLEKNGASNRKGLISVKENPIAPQVVYSYIKNNGKDSKNPFPQYTGEEVGVPGRAVVVKVDEGLAWWDEKTNRVGARAQAKAEADKAKAEKANTPAEQVVEAEQDETPVTEAE
jgi:hypothetical protein